MIKTVTITGADESVHPAQLAELSKLFPFVEWGILVSRKSVGNNRFPSLDWMRELEEEDRDNVQLSVHLCGAYVREFCMGDSKFQTELMDVWGMFNRVQVNTHGIFHDFDKNAMLQVMQNNHTKEFIFQRDDVNNNLLEVAVARDMKCSTLFDLSHGAGLLPDEWPMPLPKVKCGYAGGLGPQNLREQIELIQSKVGGTEIWIDMETHVRSTNDKIFDLKKVARCLEIAAPYVGK